MKNSIVLATALFAALATSAQAGGDVSYENLDYTQGAQVKAVMVTDSNGNPVVSSNGTELTSSEYLTTYNEMRNSK